MAAILTFTPPVGPAFPIDDTHTPRILTSQFGDGYTATSRDGINTDMEDQSVVWDNLTAVEFAQIWNFLRQLGATQRFYYAMPWAYDLGWRTVTIQVQTDNTTVLNPVIYLEEAYGTPPVVTGDNGVRGLGVSTPQLFNITDGGPELLQQIPDGFSNWAATRTLIQHDALIDANDYLLGDRMIDDGSNGVTHFITWSSYAKAALVKTYQFSVNLKADGYNYARVQLGNTTGKAGCGVDIQNMAVNASGSGAGFTTVSSTITNPGGPAAKLYICPKFDRHRPEAGAYAIKATFKQVTA